MKKLSKNTLIALVAILIGLVWAFREALDPKQSQAPANRQTSLRIPPIQEFPANPTLRREQAICDPVSRRMIHSNANIVPSSLPIRRVPLA